MLHFFGWIKPVCVNVCLAVLYSFPKDSVLTVYLQCVSRSVLSDSLRPHGLHSSRFLCPWNSPGKNSGMGFHSLLQGIFLTQGSNSGVLHCRQILYCLSHQENIMHKYLYIFVQEYVYNISQNSPFLINLGMRCWSWFCDPYLMGRTGLFSNNFHLFQMSQPFLFVGSSSCYCF